MLTRKSLVRTLIENDLEYLEKELVLAEARIKELKYSISYFQDQIKLVESQHPKIWYPGKKDSRRTCKKILKEEFKDMTLKGAIQTFLKKSCNAFTAKDIAKAIFQSKITSGEFMRAQRSCYYALWEGERRGMWRRIGAGIYSA